MPIQGRMERNRGSHSTEQQTTSRQAAQLHTEPGRHLRHGAGPRYPHFGSIYINFEDQQQEPLMIKAWTVGTLGSGGQ